MQTCFIFMSEIEVAFLTNDLCILLFSKMCVKVIFDLNKQENYVQGYSAYPWVVTHLNTDNIFLILETDTIAQRGERLELLIDKAEDLNTSVSSQ